MNKKEHKTSNTNDVVIGAFFEINDNEKIVTVLGHSGETFEALTYYAIKMDTSLKPYSWYLNHVVIGAKETNLPIEYLGIIESTHSIEDPNKKRDAE